MLHQHTNKRLPMKLRDYLLDKGIRQSDFAKQVDIGRAHLSCVITGNRKAGKKLARNIERATLGEITAESLLSGESLGYEGKPMRVKVDVPEKKSEFPDIPQKDACKNSFSLI